MAAARFPLRALRTGETGTDKALDALREDLRPLLESPLAGARALRVGRNPGLMVSGVRVFEAGDTERISLEPGGVNVIPHGLGRVPDGRIITYQNMNAVVWTVDLPTTAAKVDPTKYLALGCSFAVTIKALVY